VSSVGLLGRRVAKALGVGTLTLRRSQGLASLNAVRTTVGNAPGESKRRWFGAARFAPSHEGSRNRCLSCSGNEQPHCGASGHGAANAAFVQPSAQYHSAMNAAKAVPNKSVETDTQRQGAARRVGDRTPRGALPLCAAHLQRYAARRA
jgi:hypothetical protein